MQDLRLSRAALRDIFPQLGISLATLGSLRITYSLMKLRTTPVVVTLTGLLLLLRPGSEDGAQRLTREQFAALAHDAFLRKLTAALSV